MSGVFDDVTTRIEYDIAGNEIAWVPVRDVLRTLRSEETQAHIVAAIPHADWCCTKGCVQPRGVHIELLTGSTRDVLCPGDCTCEVGMIVPQVLAALAGEDQ